MLCYRRKEFGPSPPCSERDGPYVGRKKRKWGRSDRFGVAMASDETSAYSTDGTTCPTPETLHRSLRCETVSIMARLLCNILSQIEDSKHTLLCTAPQETEIDSCLGYGQEIRMRVREGLGLK